jgi:carboxyl-terminal processing protease
LPSVAVLQGIATGHIAVPSDSPDQIFKRSYNRIQTEYDKKIDSNQLKYAGIQGMMSSLGDPHTMFLPPVMSEEFERDTQGNFVGVGARLGKDPLGAKLQAVFEDGPAYRAGLRAGDTITAVDGKSTAGVLMGDIVQKIRGKEGTTVRITVERAKTHKKETVSIRRALVMMPTAEDQYLKDQEIGYLTVSQFSENTTEQFDRALNRLSTNNLKGLIIDLRGNPGGLLETADDMLSRFVDDKVVVTMKGRDGKQEIAKTNSGYTRTFHYPIVILINEDSASASEIFSGVLRDYHIATLVGTHSYGKMSVQNVFKLEDGSSAKITIAKYYLPNFEEISRKVDDYGQYVSGGINPDIISEFNPDDADITLGDPKTDPQLKKAIEVIQSKQ